MKLVGAQIAEQVRQDRGNDVCWSAMNTTILQVLRWVHIGFHTNKCSLRVRPENMPSAYQHPEVVSQYLHSSREKAELPGGGAG